MTDVGVFWGFCISHADIILLGGVLVALCAMQSARFLRGPETANYRLEMLLRALSNACFFLFALTFAYQSTRIANLHKVLVEMNTPYYEGGQGALPVADEGELILLQSLAGRASRFGLVALAISLIGCWFQFRSMKRQRSLAATRGGGELQTDVSNPESKSVPSA
jgi:hypothetical protein